MKRRGERELDEGFFEKFSLEMRIKRKAEYEGTRKVRTGKEENAGEDVAEATVAEATFASARVDPWVDPERFQVQALKDTELENAYLSLLRTIHLWLGLEGAQLKQATAQSHDYIQKVFSVPDGKHEDWLRQIRDIKIPKQCIHVSVIEGRDLPVRDEDGLSDPYCVLGLIKLQPEMMDGRSKTKHLQDLVEDETKLKSTTIIYNSLNPNWNEEFELEIDDLNTDCLQIDIWDSDPEKTETLKDLSHIHGFAGFRRFVHQVAQTAVYGAQDDFMGRVYVPLTEVFPDGWEGWKPVMNRYQKLKNGRLHLRIQFKFQKETFVRGHDPLTEHLNIKRQFVQYEANLFRKTEREGKLWNGQLSSIASNLLKQHFVRNGVTSLQKAAIDWLISCEYNTKFGVDSQYILQSLTELDNQWGKVSEPSNFSDANVKEIVSAIKSYQDWCAAVLSKLRDVYPATQTGLQKSLAILLQCYQKTFDLSVMRKRCPLRRFKESIYAILVTSTKIWFERQVALSEPQIQSDHDAAKTAVLADLVLKCVDDLLLAKQVYSLSFQDVAIDYLTVTFQHIDSLLAPLIQTQMNANNALLKTVDLPSSKFSDVAAATFQIYIKVKQFFQFESDFPPEVSRGIRLFKMHAWFRPLVYSWLELAYQKAQERINRALELDHVSVAALSDSVKHSSSAVDTANLLFQMRVSWEQLNWPEPTVAYGFAIKLAEYICSSAMYYANRVHEILKQKSYYNQSPEFDVTEKLCVTLNDIDYVQKALKPLPEAFDWDKVTLSLEAEMGLNAAKQSQRTLHALLPSSDENISNQIAVIVEKIGERMTVEISNYAGQIIKCPPRMTVEDSIKGLMAYLQTNLQSLNNWLLPSVFTQVLLPIYNLCISALFRIVHNRFDLVPSIYRRIVHALKILWSFFNDCGQGLSDESMQTDTYRAIMSLAEKRQAESPNLISQYLEELNRDMAKVESVNRGFLTVQVAYIRPRTALCVKILNTRNIPALDPNGMSDPYVQFQPFPASAFSGKSIRQQTKVQTKTLTAIFDETFYISASVKAFSDFNPVLVFHVYDWNRITKDDLAGETILPLSSVPHLTSEAEVDGLKQTTMSLWLPPPEPKGGLFRIIESRKWDNEAVDFVKGVFTEIERHAKKITPI
ncbi:protein unc-13 homolog D-like isoform X2 [Oscarella lobularis]|uniref:protein unc-13 homolog D-like isoform X2 n=1 Tax=Oscarella lobularis TaxID=121494 RepID=UPI0033130C13